MKRRILAAVALILFAFHISACSIVPRNLEGTQTETDNTLPEAKSREELYAEACALLKENDLYGAYEIFLSIADYGDVPNYLEHFVFLRERTEYHRQGGDDIYLDEYDLYGRLVLHRAFLENSNREIVSHYFYDEKGNFVQYEQQGGYVNNGITRYEYDDAGRPIRQIEPNGAVVELAYDSNGNITKVIGWDYIQERTYDAFGNMIENVLKDTDGIWLQTNRYVYTEHSDLLQKTIYENGGSVLTSAEYQYEYDQNGNKIKCTSMNTTSYTNYEEWKYDAQGNLIQEGFYFRNGEFVIFSFVYDETGRMTEEWREDEEGITCRQFFEYDRYGNLIRQETQYQNSPEENLVVTREYRLFYHPDRIPTGRDPLLDMPEEMVGKG